MTEQYTQTVEIPTSNDDKLKLILGILLMMLSLAFLIVAILKNKLFFIGFGVLIASGFVSVQLFESAANEYIYSISPKNLIVSKKNNAHNTKRIAIIPLDDIERIELFCDFQTNKDLVACSKLNENAVYSIIYKSGEQNDNFKRMLISPDGYMLALFKEKLNEKVTIGDEN